MTYSTKKVIFKSDGLKLIGKLITPDEIRKPAGIYLLHGAGRETNLERFTLMQEYLAKRGVCSFAIDFRGCGGSEGEFESGSIDNRLADAACGLDFFRNSDTFDKNGLTILGASMGGHIAIRLLEKNDWVKAIILQCAAAYGLETEDKLLNNTFTNAIKKEQNWENSPAFNILNNFPGKVYTFYGENDEVIPPDIQRRYNDIATLKGEAVILPHGAHALLHPKNEDQEKAMRQMFEITYEFITK
jgi:uncharacterized protein